MSVVQFVLYLHYKNITGLCKIVKNAFGKCLVNASKSFYSSSNSKLVNTTQIERFSSKLHV